MTTGRFPYKLLSKYPHMKPADVAIWERFINTNADFFDTVDYDVHVGEGAEFLPTGEDTPDGRENRLYQKKIDVVGYLGDAVWLVEVKPEADIFALGQILTYSDLAFKSMSFVLPPQLLVISAKIVNDMKEVYAKFDIKVIII